MSARRERKPSAGSTNLGGGAWLEQSLSARSQTRESSRPPTARAPDSVRRPSRASSVGGSRPPTADSLSHLRGFSSSAERISAAQCEATTTDLDVSLLGADVVNALAQADAKTQRATKFVLAVLRDRFAHRREFRNVFRAINENKSGRISREEMAHYMYNLSLPFDEKVLDLVMMQLDPTGKGIELASLVENTLRLGAWGKHDPFMGNAVRVKVTEAKRAQIAAHADALKAAEARNALRRSISANELRTQLHRASHARLADALDGGDDIVSRAEAAASRATHGAATDPLRGTLSRDELERTLGSTLGSSDFLNSTAGFRSLRSASGDARVASTGGAQLKSARWRSSTAAHGFAQTVGSGSPFDTFAPAEGKRIDIDKFCNSLHEPLPSSLGFGLSLPLGDRRPVALPRLPGSMSRFIPDDGLRAQVEQTFALNDQRIELGYTLTARKDAPLLMPAPPAWL